LFLDSHCHLDKLKLEQYPLGLADVLQAARLRRVQRFLCIGIGLDNLDTVVSIADQDPSVYASVGIHPSEYNDDSALPGMLPDVMERLTQLAQHSKVVAIGETGLDFSRLDSAIAEDPQPAQIASFRAHLALAKSLQLPVIVHTRDAQQATLDAIQECQSASAGVLHCFTESWDMAKSAIDMGYYVSISGIVTFRNADNVREVARHVPLDRLLVETDSPWLAPVPHRGRPNEPAYVVDVYHYLAELRGEPVELLAAAVWENFARLFKKVGSAGVQLNF
jgi:TatD DNase family protein